MLLENIEIKWFSRGENAFSPREYALIYSNLKKIPVLHSTFRSCCELGNPGENFFRSHMTHLRDKGKDYSSLDVSFGIPGTRMNNLTSIWSYASSSPMLMIVQSVSALRIAWGMVEKLLP